MEMAMPQHHTLPSPPFIEVEGVSNFRDIGGYQTSDGEHTRRGLVFRSADPTRATEDGLRKMSADLGLKTTFDLRSAPEIKRDGPEWEGVTKGSVDAFQPYGIHREWTPVFAEKDYGPDQVGIRYREYTRNGSEGFVKAYRDIMCEGAPAYRKILLYLGQEKPEPCLLHCTAGKDRTGVIIALIFSLVGVPDDQIADEYALTDLGLAPLKPIFIERLLKNPALEGNAAGVMNMVSSKKENMLATLEMIQQDFGGAVAYMKKNCQLTDEEIQRLKTNLVET